jgi:CheY-like chemotaxis protein
MKHSKKTILIVEDSPVQALALSLLLEHLGVNVLRAANGQSGIEMARHNMPELILLDVEMPGMNGLEACCKLRDDSGTARIPIILLTAHTDQETIRDGLIGGAIDFIPKDGFYQAVLLEMLKQMKFFEPGLVA